MHMRVLDGQGHEIDPRSIDWSSDRAPNFTIRQDSGNWNALGAVRIDMPNPYSVYMHDTSHKEFFSADYRFQSSGCARVEDPRAFAAWLLADNPGWGRREIDAAIAKGDRTDIRLTHKVPVAWIYLTGWASPDGTINFRNDVYNLDPVPAKQFMAQVDRPARVASAVRSSGFVLQSGEDAPLTFRQVSYLDSQ
jgi:murein L,D-transpeptidase YcbB/YkuD